MWNIDTVPKIHPRPGPLRPIRQSNKNSTPARWWGRNFSESFGSIETKTRISQSLPHAERFHEQFHAPVLWVATCNIRRWTPKIQHNYSCTEFHGIHSDHSWPSCVNLLGTEAIGHVRIELTAKATPLSVAHLQCTKTRSIDCISRVYVQCLTFDTYVTRYEDKSKRSTMPQPHSEITSRVTRPFLTKSIPSFRYTPDTSASAASRLKYSPLLLLRHEVVYEWARFNWQPWSWQTKIHN